MKIIFALGNPGSAYAQTRHNVGWQVIDAYANTRDTEFSLKTKFYAHVAELTVDGEKHLLVKPATYYNEVSKSARAIADFYKLAPEDFLIIHDELALDWGTVRVRLGGSDAGNNGIKSLNTHLGTNTWRMRIGTNREHPEGMAGADIVLGRLTTEETEALAKLMPELHRIINQHIAGTLEVTTRR